MAKEKSGPGSMNKILSFIAITGVLCVVILYVYSSSKINAKDGSILRLTHFDVVRSNSDSYDPKKPGESVTLPDSWREHQKPRIRNSWYRTQIELDSTQKSFAVFIPRVSMNASVSINGNEIGNGGRFTEPISRNHSRPLLFVSPLAITEQDRNIDLAIRVSDNSWALGFLGPVYVGDTATLTSMYRKAEFWHVHLTIALALLMSIFSVASFALHFRREKEKFYFWFGLAMLLFAVDTFNIFIIDIPVSRHVWDIYHQMVIYTFAFATIVFIHRFTKIGLTYMEPVLGGVFVIKFIVLMLVDVNHLYFAGSIFNLMIISYGFLLAFLVTQSYFREARFETGVSALSGIMLLAVATHTLLVQFGVIEPEHLHIIHYGAPCFFLLFSLSLARKFLLSLESAEALASELDKRVQQKERELAATYHELALLTQKKTLSEERARIMREVHDGFGSHLVGALAMLETDKVNGNDLAEYLKSSLLDLRIMIDSLDPNTHEVTVAFGMLRARVEPILRNKNIALDWELHKLPDNLPLNPKKTLCLLRILQELITNTLKHSAANQIKIESLVKDGSQERILSINYYENGTGFDPSIQTGKGIRNITKRIFDLGGEIVYSKLQNGFNTAITIPGFPLAEYPPAAEPCVKN